jgi:hypothetical protein
MDSKIHHKPKTKSIQFACVWTPWMALKILEIQRVILVRILSHVVVGDRAVIQCLLPPLN